MQSRLGSFIEAIANVLIGYLISVYAMKASLAAVGIVISVGQAHSVGVVMTVVSISRSFLLRRLFNAISARRSKTC